MTWLARVLLTSVLIGAFVEAGLGAGKIAADEGLAVIAHPTNALRTIDARKLKQIYTAQSLFWPGGERAIPLNYPAGDSRRVAFDRAVLGMEPDRVGEFWVDQLVRARARPPRKLSNPKLVVRVVAQLPGAIGYVPAALVTAEVKVLARVANGKVVSP